MPGPFLGLQYPFPKTISEEEGMPVLDVTPDTLGFDGLSNSFRSLHPIGHGSDCVELDLRAPFICSTKGVLTYPLYPCPPDFGFSEGRSADALAKQALVPTLQCGLKWLPETLYGKDCYCCLSSVNFIYL